MARTAALALAAGIWLSPVPAGLGAPAWHLFAIFAAAIFSVVVNAWPLLTASVLAVAAAVLSGTVPAAKAYSGFANGAILLIVVAFLMARAMVKCGLGQRIGYAVISVFGRSTLGLAYSVFFVDAWIAPAFPSNTARSGIIYPLVSSLGRALGALPGAGARRRLGAFLMFSGLASLSLSSTLWLTAMVGNPLGAEMARRFGVSVSFGSWVLAASVPTFVGLLLVPWVLYRVMRPEVKATPEAPLAARRALAALGPLSREERIAGSVFVAMVGLWAASGLLQIDTTAVGFLGLGVLLTTGILTLDDVAKEGEVLSVFIWFAVLFALSGQLNELGFVAFLGQKVASAMGGLSWPAAGLVLVAAYVLLHYLFVSQTAHILAVFGVFLEVGVRLGVPAAPLAYLLLFASNFFSVITPQGSSANLLFVGSGYLSQGELYRLGLLTTAVNLLVYLIVGAPWLLWLLR